MKKNKLYIFGAGHTGQALAKYAIDMDFETVVIDDRKEYLDQISQPEINKMPLDFSQALTLLPFDEQTFVAIMSYDHAIDRNILAYCIKKPHAYLGMIGSSRKVELTKKMFSEAGIATAEELNSVDMPMGIDIKSESPEEIAISILAKLIETKYTKLK
jgi:xanthine dehydrogenase accessory factor